jgi:hypothetical protein
MNSLRPFPILFSIVAFALYAGPHDARATQFPLSFCCQAENDLYRTMQASGVTCRAYHTPAEAVDAASDGSAVLILADGYPQTPTVVPPAVLQQAAKKRLRLYLEFPAELPDMKVGTPQTTSLERVVVNSDIFGDALKRLQIVAIHDCHFVPVECRQAHLVVGKVAGLDRAVYGLNDVKTWPILFEHPNGRMLVCTTKLSQFVTARYAPRDALQSIWRMVFAWLQPGSKPVELDWTPTVRPTFARDAKLPRDASRRAIQRAIDWHTAADMFAEGKDGRAGVKEGIKSTISYDGRQPINPGLRSDCNGESSLAFALRWKLDGDVRSRTIAGNLLDWIYFNSRLFEKDPKQGTYGLLYWFATPDKEPTPGLYQDNDVKAILGCLGTSALLGTDRWNEAIVKNILGNFRTTGIHGFRGGRLEAPNVKADGWQKYWRSETIDYQPHYEAWIWATYLWLYDKTHFQPLLTRTRNAINMMMKAYPGQWLWANGFQQERGRMLLTLAWLVRVDDQPQHRAWLKQIASDIERSQDACGAIPEELGDPRNGGYPPPRSNAEYGANEASLIHANGDPVADLLYTCNFTFLGLQEAYAATGDLQYRRMADRLADFLLRIQVRSESHPELDGSWFRAFDYKKWEYWGSNADFGWGAWSVEVGWTQAWLPTVLSLRELNTSLWELSKNSRAGDCFEPIRRQMLPDKIISPGKVKK